MNGDLALVQEFVSQLNVSDKVDTLICPPACFVGSFDKPNFMLGAQNVSHAERGAHTGELSSKMLKSMNVTHVIVGHSERRENHGETNELIGEKVKACLADSLTPVLCIGESLEVRESGQLFEFLKEQLDAVLKVCGEKFVPQTVIAYEPVWAIGTGKTASPEQAQEVHAFIRVQLAEFNAEAASKTRILYGGSMNAKNAEELLAQPDIDGGLIGGASLKIDDFKTICSAAG